MTLTLGRRAHAGLYDLVAAVNDLPALVPPSNPPDANVGVLRATGADYRPLAGKDKNSLGLQSAISGDFLRQGERELPGSDIGLSTQETLEITPIPHDFQGSEKVKAMGFEPMTYGLKVRCSTS